MVRNGASRVPYAVSIEVGWGYLLQNNYYNDLKTISRPFRVVNRWAPWEMFCMEDHAILDRFNEANWNRTTCNVWWVKCPYMDILFFFFLNDHGFVLKLTQSQRQSMSESPMGSQSHHCHCWLHGECVITLQWWGWMCVCVWVCWGERGVCKVVGGVQRLGGLALHGRLVT